jgi:hypothetical protein
MIPASTSRVLTSGSVGEREELRAGRAFEIGELHHAHGRIGLAERVAHRFGQGRAGVDLGHGSGRGLGELVDDEHTERRSREAEHGIEAFLVLSYRLRLAGRPISSAVWGLLGHESSSVVLAPHHVRAPTSNLDPCPRSV